MSIGFLFWLLMILWLVLGLWAYWPGPVLPAPPYAAWRPYGLGFVLFVLLLLLGLRVFGFPITA